MNKMKKKSRKLLLISTVLTIIAIVSVLTVYAAVLIGTYQGGEVVIGGVGSGTIEYSTTNSTGGSWSTTLAASDPTASWYAELVIDGSNTYSGPVTISWQLQIETSPGVWSPVGSPVITNMNLATGAQTVYASSDGTITANTDWSITVNNFAGTYSVKATVDSV